MRATFKHNKSVEDTRGNNNKDPRAEDQVDMLKVGKAWMRVRPVGPTAVKGIHWVPVDLAKSQAAAAGKAKERPKSFPQVCLAYNPETEEVDSTIECPWCRAEQDAIRLNSSYYQNFIVRDLQEDEPKKKGKETKKEAKTGFKEKGSPAWTPIRVLPMSNNLINEIKAISALNRHKDKKTGEKKAFPLSHPKYGCDILIMYDAEEKVAAKRWKVQISEKSALTEDEENYLMWDIESLDKPKSVKDAKEEYKRWAKRQKSLGSSRDDDDSDDDDEDNDLDDDDDEDDEPKSKKGKNKKSKDKGGKKSKKSKDEDDDDLDDSDLDDDEDDDEDEDDEPKSKSKKGKNKKSKDDDDDDDIDEDDDDLDEDDEDDDEDDEPKSKSKSKSKKGKGGKKSRDDDDDDDLDDDDLDDDDDDDDDEDDEPKKGKKSKKSRDDDDDDDDDLDDDDLDDEDEDDEPKSKSKSKKSKGKDKKSKKSKGKKSRDDDDEDD